MGKNDEFPSRDEIEKLSTRFSSLMTRAHCSACNGYYGPAFGQPVCPTCHAFLYANVHDAEINIQLVIMLFHKLFRFKFLHRGLPQVMSCNFWSFLTSPFHIVTLCSTKTLNPKLIRHLLNTLDIFELTCFKLLRSLFDGFACHIRTRIGVGL